MPICKNSTSNTKISVIHSVAVHHAVLIVAARGAIAVAVYGKYPVKSNSAFAIRIEL